MSDPNFVLRNDDSEQPNGNTAQPSESTTPPAADETAAQAPREPTDLVVMRKAQSRSDDFRADFNEERFSHLNATQERASGGGSLRMVAVIAVAAICGAMGGALATGAVSQFGARASSPAAPVATAEDIQSLNASVAKINDDLAALKSTADQAGKTRSTQIDKLDDRLDKIEKAQGDLTSRIGKLAEAQDKLRTAAATPAPAAQTPTRVASAETTAAVPAARPDPRRPQIVDGWSLNRVGRGGAIVEGHGGLYEVYPGDPLPGLGTVQDVRYVDGRWAVVTSRGLIVRR